MKKRERILLLECELDAWRREAQAGGRAIKRLERDLAASRETSVKVSGVCDRLRVERDVLMVERDRLRVECDEALASRGRLAGEVHRLMLERRVPSPVSVVWCQRCAMFHRVPGVHRDGAPVVVVAAP